MPPEPVATYRLQLQPGFGFEEAAGIIAYLSELGISHLYTSPCLQAAAGSTHGYDVVDPNQINAQLGGEEAHTRFCEAVQAAGLALMIDIVPNHMAIEGKQNPWWWDVLENGPSSLFASFFDVDWDASDERWRNKVLLPVLGNHYGRILEKNELQLSFQAGSVSLHYKEHSFPVDPSSLAGLFSRAAGTSHSELLGFIAESYARLPTSRRTVTARHRDKDVLFKLLTRLCSENSNVVSAIQAEIARLNQNPDELDALIEKQNYRLAFWRTISRDLGYRRFFDVKDLVGLKIEDIEVFRRVHALPFKWFVKGWAQGLRIDHPDGLRNPGEYFRRLKEACPGAWIVAEKILAYGETLPSDWNVAGTTGYDFLNLITGLFVAAKNEELMTQSYWKLTGNEASYEELVYICKKLVLTDLFGSELNRLTTLFVEVCETHRRQRDYTRPELREALCEIAAFFPVYRAYVSASENRLTKEDERYVSEAVKRATEKRSDLDPELFHFLEDILLLRIQGTLEGELVMRFQQLTGPAMAKGVEDTAFYRYNRLLALNEVGGNPGRFGTSLQQFHETCLTAQTQRSLSLLASTTHDTKRSEDVRARLTLLSEIPIQFAEAVQRWMNLNQKFRTQELPERNMELFFYQTLIGAWPIDQKRLLDYMQKAARESKEFTSWTKINEAYEEALNAFVQGVMQNQTFLSDFEHFIAPLIYPGRINSLAQTLIKLTSPGIPDLYQGCELWNLTLVDPDNRRLVDYALREQLSGTLKHLSPEQIMEKMDEGMPKLWVIRQTLQLRKLRSTAFSAQGAYKPLFAHGEKAEHVLAFMRGGEVITITPRLVLGINNEWGNSTLDLPQGPWQNILTGEAIKGGSAVSLQQLLGRFPVALLGMCHG